MMKMLRFEEEWTCVVCGKKKLAWKPITSIPSPYPQFLCKECRDESNRTAKEAIEKLIQSSKERARIE